MKRKTQNVFLLISLRFFFSFIRQVAPPVNLPTTVHNTYQKATTSAARVLSMTWAVLLVYYSGIQRDQQNCVWPFVSHEILRNTPVSSCGIKQSCCLWSIPWLWQVSWDFLILRHDFARRNICVKLVASTKNSFEVVL